MNGRVTIEIRSSGAWRRMNEIEALVGANRIYLKGTDSGRYLDCRDRAEADLLVTNLNLMPGVRARVLG